MSAYIFSASYREKLARNQIIRGRQQEAEQTRYSHLVADLLAEKDSWITKENIDAKITDSLFEKQTTTGIVTKTSDLWRLQVISVDLDRVMSPELANEYTGQTLSDRLSRRGQFREAKKLYVQDILNPMIGSGEERANFKQLVEEFTATLDKAEAFEAFDFYNQTVSVLCMLSSRRIEASLVVSILICTCQFQTFDHDSSEAIDHPHDLEEDHEMYFNPNTDDDEVDAAAVVSRGRGGAAGGKGKVVKGKAAPVTKGKGKR